MRGSDAGRAGGAAGVASHRCLSGVPGAGDGSRRFVSLFECVFVYIYL